jgi:long-chain acyl-CoA synthetase
VTDRIWLKNYSSGVPADADCDAYPSVNHLFESAVRRYHALPAFSNMGTTLSYGDIDRLAHDFAGSLQKDLDLKKGERLAIMLPNVLQYPVVLFGAFLAGLTVVNVNPLYTARELLHQLTDSDTHAIVVLENFAHTVQEVRQRCDLRTVVTTRVGDLLSPPASFITNFVVKYVRRGVPPWIIPGALAFKDIVDKGRGRDLRAVALTANDIAFIQYTSGTTGAPKGAVLTHGNVIANVRQNNLWSGNRVKDGEEVVVTPLPLYHVLSLMVNLLSYFNFGGHDILITAPRDIGQLIKELKKRPFTVITGVNTLYKALLDAPGFTEVDTSRLKSAVAGGATVAKSVAERWKTATGVAIVEGYGLTEAGVVACNPLDSAQWSGNVGLPYPSTEVGIRDDEGKELPPGEIGEICVHGPQVMRGYWNRPDDTAKAFTKDGWLRTGDVGFMDPSGRIKLVDRKKDMIVVSGFKVYPAEIEEVVGQLPSVEDCAAIGVPDADSGEAVLLLVVRRDPRLDAGAVMSHCRDNLTGYKCPRSIEFRSALPETPIGKVLKKELRDAMRAAGERAHCTQ